MGASRRTVLAAFLGVAILGGGNAVGVRFSNRELDPLWGATVRFGLAGALLLVWVWARRIPMPRGRQWQGPVVFGVLNYAMAFSLAYYGLVEIQAGFGQTLLATVPLFALLLAVIHHQERLSLAGLFGTVLAALGVGVMSGFSFGGTVPILSVLALIGGAACFAEAAVMVRRFPRVHPIAMNAVAASVGALILVTLSAIAGETWSLPGETETWAAIAFLVVIGSAVVFGLYLFVLDNWPASRAAYGFVIIPIVTFALSAWLDDEPLGFELLGGAALVLGGVYLGAILPGARERPPSPSPGPRRLTADR